MAKEHRDQRVNNFHVNPINLAGYRTSDRRCETNLLKISRSNYTRTQNETILSKNFIFSYVIKIYSEKQATV